MAVMLPIDRPPIQHHDRPESSVFHRADCKSAAEISEKNLVHCNTRDEAIQAGKMTCHECSP